MIVANQQEPCSLFVFRDNVRALALGEVVAKVHERSYLHLLLRVASFRAHVREEGRVWELEETRVYFRLIGIHVEADGAELR